MACVVKSDLSCLSGDVVQEGGCAAAAMWLIPVARKTLLAGGQKRICF